MRGRKRRSIMLSGRWVYLAVLVVCCLGGILLGQVLPVAEETGGELRRYLGVYAALEPERRPGWLQALVVYLRYPLMAFGLGFLPSGGVLVCLLSAVFGFFLSYAVCCFAAALGPAGVLLALSVMGLRCVVTLPCFLWVGVSVIERTSFGRGRGKGCWLALAAALPVLLIAVCADLLMSPILLKWALERIVI